MLLGWFLKCLFFLHAKKKPINLKKKLFLVQAQKTISLKKVNFLCMDKKIINLKKSLFFVHAQKTINLKKFVFCAIRKNDQSKEKFVFFVRAVWFKFWFESHKIIILPLIPILWVFWGHLSSLLKWSNTQIKLISMQSLNAHRITFWLEAALV